MDIISKELKSKKKRKENTMSSFALHHYLIPVSLLIKTSHLNSQTGHDALTPSFIKFRLYAPFPTLLHPSMSIFPIFPPPNPAPQYAPPAPLHPVSTSLLASNVAGKAIWRSHLCQKDGGGLQRAHSWLQRRFRVRVCLSQPALIIFRCIWWPFALVFLSVPSPMCVCMCVCMCLNDL